MGRGGDRSCARRRGIEIGKRMMAEMIAAYPSQGKSPATAAPAANGSGYLNEVSSLSARTVSDGRTPRQD
jgi:hypothetical protein